MNVHLAALLAVALVSAGGAYWSVRRWRRLTGPLAAFGFVILSLSVLPRVWPSRFYYLFPSGDAGEVALAAAFVLGGALAAGYRDSAFRIVLQVLLAPLMIYFVLFPAFYVARHGDELRWLDLRVVDGVTLQSNNYACLPSSVATVLRLYGIERTEGELAYALRTTPMGTDYARVPRVVALHGADASLEARFVRPSLAELREAGEPGLLMVYAGPILHAVALLGFEGKDVIVGDPLEGRVRIPEVEFIARTKWTGLAVLISPGS